MSTMRRILVGLLLSLALAGCGDSSGGSPVATGSNVRSVANGNTLDQPVPAATMALQLVDQDGRPWSLQQLRGKVVVMAPFMTFCQETCPMTSANMQRAARDSQRAGTSDQVVFVELSVDPARDSVRRLRAYQARYGAQPAWELVTGDPARVTALWKALGVSMIKTPSDEPVRDWFTGEADPHPYDIEHQDVVIVIGSDGHVHWLTVGLPDARGTRLPTTMQRFLNDEGRKNLAHPDAVGPAWTVRDVDQAVDYALSLEKAG